jgi:multiple sugar transport system ATP-binding protein
MLDPVGTVPATVQTVEHLGSESFIHLRAHSGEDLVARGTPDLAVRPDDIVQLRFAPGWVHRFDAEDRAVPANHAVQEVI